MNSQERSQLGERVEAARLRRGLSKEKAAREADVSSITLKRIEDGEKVRDDSLARVLRYFALPMPGRLNIETPVADVRMARELIEGADISQELKDRLLGVLSDPPSDDPPPTSREVKGA